MTDISAAIGKTNPDFPQRTGGISLEELSFKADLNACTLGTNQTRSAQSDD